MKYSVFFGRFQLPHAGHIEVIKNALKNTQRLIIIIGSTDDKCTSRNPFSYTFRKKMLTDYLSEQNVTLSNIHFRRMKDYVYNDMKWETEARRVVNSIVDDTDEVLLTGYKKDGTSYYLSMFPEWGELPFNTFYHNLSSSNIRKSVIQGDIHKFKNDISRMLYRNIRTDNPLIVDALREFKKAEYVDDQQINVVVSSGHVLLEKKDGMFSLIMSKVNPNFDMNTNSINNIKETGIKLTENILNSRKQRNKLFDDINRTESNYRILGFTSFYKLMSTNKLPKVNNKYTWMSLDKVNRKIMIDDHFYIIKYFTTY